MNREILFRGKRIDNGEWLEGYYAVIGKRKVIIAYPEMFFDDNGKEVYANEIKDVDSETVGWYTGLTDKKGRKIFEGDCLGHRLNVVEYLNGCFTVSGDRPLSLMAKYNEVIGNIFDNPELMK